MVPAHRREILLNFPIPRQIVLTLNERRQFRQFPRRQLTYSLLDLGKTHDANLTANLTKGNAVSPPSPANLDWTPPSGRTIFAPL